MKNLRSDARPVRRRPARPHHFEHQHLPLLDSCGLVAGLVGVSVRLWSVLQMSCLSGLLTQALLPTGFGWL
jgi:hypothetical protein